MMTACTLRTMHSLQPILDNENDPAGDGSEAELEVFETFHICLRAFITLYKNIELKIKILETLSIEMERILSIPATPKSLSSIF